MPRPLSKILLLREVYVLPFYNYNYTNYSCANDCHAMYMCDEFLLCLEGILGDVGASLHCFTRN